jgi:riboflavin biosynthesis pyrimidine reductase
MEFPYINFQKEAVTLINCFSDKELIEEIHGKGNAGAYLPKVADTYGKIIFPEGKTYPYIYSSIALSMDGKMAYPDNRDGDMLVRSNTLNPDGAQADFYVLNLLRAYSDAVLIGTKSMKTEANEWVTCHDFDLVRERVKYLQKREQPFVIVATKNGLDLPFDHMLFHQDKLPVLVFTSPRGLANIEEKAPGAFFELREVTEQSIWASVGKNAVIVTGSGEETDIPVFITLLKRAGVNHLLIESPTFMWFLMREGLMNEFFITHSSIFVGGGFTPGTGLPFTFDNHPQSRLVRLNRHGNTFLYSRQLIRHEQ